MGWGNKGGFDERKAQSKKAADVKKKAEKLHEVGKGKKQRDAWNELVKEAGGEGKAAKAAKQAGIDVNQLKRQM